MLEQFQNVLLTPKPAQINYYKLIQDSMLNTMESIMPHDFDFGELAKLFDKDYENENSASLTYKLTQFFVKVVTQNFISLQSYYSLQHQTQKLQSTIRGHIKMEQEMKMYLQHLEYKIQRYEYHLNKMRKQHHHQNLYSQHQLKQFREKETIDHLKKKQTQLLKQRIVLLRKVDHLERRLKDQQNQLQRLNSPSSATIMQIREGFNRQRRISQEKPQQLSPIINLLEPQKSFHEIDRRMSTHSFTSDHQITQKKSSNIKNPAQVYRLYSLTGKQQARVQNQTSVHLMQTIIKQIQFVESKNLILLESNNSPIENLALLQ